jgi:hypothetical protein
MVFVTMDRTTFNQRLETDVIELPKSIAAVGITPDREILVYHWTETDCLWRLKVWLEYFQTSILPHLKLKSKYAFLFCLNDGFRERIPFSDPRVLCDWMLPEAMAFAGKGEVDSGPGLIPKLASQLQLFAFDRHDNDPFTQLVVDTGMIWGYFAHEARLVIAAPPFDRRIPKIAYGCRLGNGLPQRFGDFNGTPREYLCYRVHQQKDSRLTSILRLEADGKLATEEMLKYRYLLDVDGYTNSWGLPWKLRSGSVVIKQQTRWTQWYYDRLKPWVHYAPCAPDFSDLHEVYAKLEANPELVAFIRRNAQLFMDQYLTTEAIRKEMVVLFQSDICLRW